jgi:hypothetical protein
LRHTSAQSMLQHTNELRYLFLIQDFVTQFGISSAVCFNPRQFPAETILNLVCPPARLVFETESYTGPIRVTMQRLFVLIHVTDFNRYINLRLKSIHTAQAVIQWTVILQGVQKSLNTWLLQYVTLQVMFKVSPDSLQTFIDKPGGH